MNIDDLNHSKTPTALQEVNAKIVAQLNESAVSSQEPDAKSDFFEFKALLVLRDEVIKQHLDTLHSEEKQVFEQQQTFSDIISIDEDELEEIFPSATESPFTPNLEMFLKDIEDFEKLDITLDNTTTINMKESIT